MYKLKEGGVIRLDDGAHIPDVIGNADWGDYQRWLDQGNTPLPADPEPKALPNPSDELNDALAALDPASINSLTDVRDFLTSVLDVLQGRAGKASRIAGKSV